MKTTRDYSYNRFNSKGVRVGQAVHDILSKKSPVYTAEEILEEMEQGIVSYIQDAVEKGCAEYSGDFFILHLFKKELSSFGVDNVMMQKAACFKSRCWKPFEVMEMHPNSTKSLYKVNSKNGTVVLEWTIPGWSECMSIKRNPELYDPQLVNWVNEATTPLSA